MGWKLLQLDREVRVIQLCAEKNDIFYPGAWYTCEIVKIPGRETSVILETFNSCATRLVDDDSLLGKKVFIHNGERIPFVGLKFKAKVGATLSEQREVGNAAAWALIDATSMLAGRDITMTSEQVIDQFNAHIAAQPFLQQFIEKGDFNPVSQHI